jgi:MFS family permease
VTLRELRSDRGFCLYLVGQTTSGTGSALSSVALVFAVLSISRSPGSVGLVLLSSRLPGIALTLTGGLIADRRSRQWIAVSADVTRTLTQLATGLLLLTGTATVLELAALQTVTGGASAMFGPAANALLAGIAPRGQIRRASSLLSITTAIGQTGGLAVSGLIVALAGPGTSLLIDGMTFAVSSLTLALIPAVQAASPHRKKLLSDLRDGWQVARSHRWLLIYATHETIVNVLVLSPFFVLGPVIARARFGGAPAWSAIALAYVVGSLAAANVTYHWAPKRPVLAALTISSALAPMLALLGSAAPLWLILPAALLAGLETTIYNTLLGSALLANLPDRTLGRATAITGIGSTMLVPVGMGLAGIAAAAIGTRTVMLCGAALVLATTVICTWLPAARVKLELDRQTH